MATADQLRAEANRLLEQAFLLAQQARVATQQGNATLAQQLLEESRTLSAQANRLIQQADDLSQESPTSSAGQVVANAQQARENNAVVQNPSEPNQSVDLVDPQANTAENIEFGTNGRVRRLTETQATPPPTAQQYSTPGEDATAASTGTTATPTQYSGVGARGEDGVTPNANTTQRIINANLSQRIDPQPNVLDQYASYTYSLSWYLLTPDQFNAMQRQQKKNINNWILLVQSGGAPIQRQIDSFSASGQVGRGDTTGRSDYFRLDYYMDNLVIENQFAPGTGSAVNVTRISFTVTEPNGITLIPNLNAAARDTYKKNNVSTIANFQQAQYCLVIRFYGYDDYGNLVQVGRNNVNGNTNLTDPRAVVEKFIPFTVQAINTSIVSNAIEYKIECTPTPYFVNGSTNRGTIPFNYELVGTTVDQILNGRPVGTTYLVPDDGRRDAPQPPTAPTQAGAGVDALGNFNGSSDSPFTVVAP